MDERDDKLEMAIEAIRSTVTQLEGRIAALESVNRGAAVLLDEEAVNVHEGDLDPEIVLPPTDVMGTLTLVGRSLLVFAGAFLLRALTEGGTLSSGVGVAAGVAYGVIWILASAFVASRGARASAGFYAVCAAVIVGPLLFEASTSFDVLSPTAGIAILAGVTIAGWFVATRWRLHVPAWVFTLGCLITAASVATLRPPGEAATAALVALGLGSLWIADKFGWTGLKWLTAFSADLAVLRITAMATATGELPESVGAVHPTFVGLIQAVLVVGFVGTFVVESLRGRRSIGAFEFVQTAAVWVVGWGGAIRLAHVNGWATGALAFLAVIAGVAAYAGAFGVVDRKQGRSLAFIYLSSLGLGLILVGLPGVVGGAGSMVWAFLAVGAAVVGSRWDRVTLRVHAGVLLIAAWLSSGAVLEAFADLGGGGGLGANPRVETLVVGLLTLVTTLVVILGRRLRSAGWAQRLPLTGLLFMTAVAIAAAIVEVMAALLSPGSAVGVGTVALSLVTVGLAVLTKRWGIVEAGWLVYPLLVVTGLRMVAIDFSSGKTLVLVIALAAYGTALIVSTRLIGRSKLRFEPDDTNSDSTDTSNSSTSSTTADSSLNFN